MRFLHQHLQRSRRNASGYTLIEALLLVIILSIVATGLGTSMGSTADSTQSNESTLAIDNTLVSQMETLRANWASDPVGVTSTPITVDGTTYTMTQTIAQAAPNTGGVQATFYSLTIQINGRSISTLVSS